MNINNLEKLTEDKELFEKVLLAYWYSVPSDSDRNPDQMKNIKDRGKFFGVDLVQKSITYGYASIPKFEIERYIIKLKELPMHEDDIIDRIDKESE